MSNKLINDPNFDFTAFQKESILKIKFRQALTGKDGVLTPSP